MFIRLVRTTGPDSPAERGRARAIWQEEVESRLKQQPGYLGAVGMHLESGPDGATATYWQDREAIERANAAMMGGPQVGATNERSGRTVTNVDIFEVAFAARPKPPSADTFLRSNDVQALPDRLDTGIANVKDRVYPVVSGQPGFRSLLCAVNRESGRMIVSTAWDSLDDLNRSEAAVVDLREESVKASGATSATVEKWAVTYASVVLPAGVQR